MLTTGLRTLLAIVFSLASLGVACAEPPRFSRPTVKFKVLGGVPKWHRKIYEDKAYGYFTRNYGRNEYVPGFFIHDKRRNRWLQLVEISTEHAKLGRSPDFSDIPLQVSWDFRGLARKKYVPLPLRTSGSIVFPDRISFDKRAQTYRLDCNSSLKRKQSLTYFWVRKAELDGMK